MQAARITYLTAIVLARHQRSQRRVNPDDLRGTTGRVNTPLYLKIVFSCLSKVAMKQSVIPQGLVNILVKQNC